MIRAAQRQGWGLKFVSGETKNREKNPTIRARQRAIGRELRRMYENIANEPIPDDLLNLLQKIEEHSENHGDDNQ